MGIKIHASQKPTILYVVSWIFFILVCIEAGSYIFNAIFMLLFKSDKADYFGFFDLYEYDTGHFLVIILLLSIVAIMQAIMFYLIIKIIGDKKLDMSRPFNKEMRHFLLNLSYLALGIGLFTGWGANYTEWVVSQGVEMPDSHFLHLGGHGVWLLMGMILYIIADIFKKGIEFQSENEMTI